MYEAFFGLKRKPFRANPKGADVFVGPQTARIVKSIKNALVGSDAVVAVTGPAGIGKSTLVNRALDAFARTMETIRIPRAQLGHDEILDFLLERLAVENLPASTIRRVLLCREVLARKTQAGCGVCIVVEDAERIGTDALVEIEALTAGEGNDEHGARVVLLGAERLPPLLQEPAHSRLAQRTRLRFQVQPLGPGELLAYLKHGLRLVGGDFDAIFEANTAGSLHALSGGVPRVVNNLVDAAMSAAAEAGARTISADSIANIARDQFGIELPPVTANDRPASSPVTAAAGEAPGTSAQERAQEPRVHSGVRTKAAAGETLIQDTLPDLEQLAPELARAAATAGEDSAEIPTLFSSTRIETLKAAPASKPRPAERRTAPSAAREEKPAEKRETATARPVVPLANDDESPPAAPSRDMADVPAWDKDPTFAELRPDLEALELAMAEFSRQEAPQKPASKENEAVVELKEPTFCGLPEITLDVAIQQKIAEAAEALRKHDQTIAEEEIEDAPTSGNGTAANDESPDDESADDMKKLAEGIAKAKSLEDVDDRMAETLFGEEFSAIARAVAANAPQADEADEGPAGGEAEPVELQLENDTDDAEAADTSVESALEREFREVYGTEALEVSLQSDTRRGGLDLSASQRLATVRALNAERKLSESTRPRGKGGNGDGRGLPRSVPSQTIEEQIATSMTQTLKALSVRPANDDSDDDDDDDDDKKGGFFSRFRRH